MSHASTLTLAFAVALLLSATLTHAHYPGDGHDHGEDDEDMMMDPEERMMREQEGMRGPREKVSIGVLHRPKDCTQRVAEGSRVAVTLTLSKVVPSETKAGVLDKVNIYTDKKKLILAGSGRFLEGVEEGLYGACKGEKRSLRIPASLAFGEEGSRKLNVPPGTDLRAVVEVEDMEEVDPYNEDMDDSALDEDMDEQQAPGRGGEDDDGEDDDDEKVTGPAIAEEDFHFHVPKVSATEFSALVDKKKNIFVMFFAPWCGHCTAIKPKFAKVGRALRGDAKVAVVAVDATENEALAEEFGVEGYPTFVMLKDGASPKKYDAARTTIAMVNAVNEAFGTERLPNGRLTETSGTDAELNIFVEEWHAEIKTLEQLRTSLPDGSYYRRVVESISTHGKDYIVKEKSRLEKMLLGGTTTAKVEQLDSMQRRYNILNVFHNERA